MTTPGAVTPPPVATFGLPIPQRLQSLPMATNIPPHNLSEVIDGLIGLIETPDITIKQLMRHIPGPDFPTAGFIHGKEPIVQAYHEGKGIVQMRGKAFTETVKRTGKEQVIISEIPYMFVSFPAGLTVYWLVNNVLTIGQQYWINRSVK